MATGENAAHGVLCQAIAPQGTLIDNLVNKYDLEYYFNNLAAALTMEKVLLDQLMAAIAALTINNEALVTINSKIVADVTNLTRGLGRNTDSATSKTNPDK